MSGSADWLDAVAWNSDGLVPVIAQEADSQRVLMLAWMNRDALAETAQSGYATYWSRSRGELWRKGESSGHRQRVHAIRADCDNDTILLEVEQIGGIACHTGRHSCFYQQLDDGIWSAVDPIQRNPDEIYG